MSMRQKQVRLTAEESNQVKWLLGSLLGLLSLWSLWSLDLQSGLYVLVGALCVAYSLVLPQQISRLPVGIWRPVGLVLLLIVGIDFVIHLPEFMPPLVRMVVLLLVYRIFAPRKRREDLQLVLLSLFCLVISGVLTVSLLFAFQILIFTPVAMSMLFLICILDRHDPTDAPQVTWERFSHRRLLRRIFLILDYRVLFLGSLMFGFVVAVSTVLFVLTPRFNIEQAIPYLQMKTNPRAGFSENVKLGKVSEIAADRSVAMRVDVPSLEAIDAAPYWRILTLDKYDSGNFRASSSLKGSSFRTYPKTRELMGRDMLNSDFMLGRESSDRWTLYLEGGVSQFLPIPGLFHSMRFEGVQDLIVLPGMHHVGLDSVRQRVFSYQIEDLRWTHRFPALPLEKDIFSALPMSVEGDDLDYPFTTLEVNLNENDRAYLKDLNASIIGSSEALNAASYSELVTNYLWRRFQYTLTPEPIDENVDAVVGWLRDSKAGHCEYFAGAFILLARDAGYPARMVVGFSGGSWNVVEEYFVIRNDNAHAWAEIYDAKTNEWLRVDPTPGSGSSNPDISTPGSQLFEAGWDAWLDSLRIQWYRRVVNFDQSDQLDMAITMKDVWDDIAKQFSERVKGIGERLSSWWKQPFSRSSWVLVGYAALVCVGVSMLWLVRYSILGLLHRLLRRPKALDPVRRQASRYLKRMKVKGIHNATTKELEALRFGPDADRKSALPVFREARRALRARRKS